MAGAARGSAATETRTAPARASSAGSTSLAHPRPRPRILLSHHRLLGPLGARLVPPQPWSQEGTPLSRELHLTCHWIKSCVAKAGEGRHGPPSTPLPAGEAPGSQTCHTHVLHRGKALALGTATQAATSVCHLDRRTGGRVRRGARGQCGHGRARGPQRGAEHEAGAPDGDPWGPGPPPAAFCLAGPLGRRPALEFHLRGRKSAHSRDLLATGACTAGRPLVTTATAGDSHPACPPALAIPRGQERQDLRRARVAGRTLQWGQPSDVQDTGLCCPLSLFSPEAAWELKTPLRPEFSRISGQRSSSGHPGNCRLSAGPAGLAQGNGGQAGVCAGPAEVPGGRSCPPRLSALAQARGVGSGGGRVFQLAVRLLPFPSATASPRPVACAHHLFLAGRGLVLRARARLRWGAVQACGDLPSTAAGGHEAGTQRLFPRGRSAATLSALRVLCGLEPPSPRLRQGWWHCLTPGRSDGDTQCPAHGSARTSLPVHRPARWPPGRGASSHMQGSPEPCRPRKLT